jgi:hypothetical protein
MEQKPVRKLNLGKKTITRLNENESKIAQGGTFGSIIYATGGCITRGCGSDFTRPGTIIIIQP